MQKQHENDVDEHQNDIKSSKKNKHAKKSKKSKTVKTGRRKLEKWLKTAQPCYGTSVQTIWNHFDGICNHFRNRTTSGVMAGINNRMKLKMLQGYGFSNFENFRSRLLACLGD